MQHKTSVNIIAKDEKGRYLLQMRDSTVGICDPLTWNLFGGKIEADEDIIDAGIREFLEETGVSDEKKMFQHIGHVMYRDDAKEVLDTIHLVEYVGRVVWKDLDIAEGAGAGFFTLEEIQKIPITDRLRQIYPILQS